MPPEFNALSFRPTRWEWTLAILFAGNLTWTTLCLGGYRPDTMVLSATLTGMLLAAHFLVTAFRLNPGSNAHPAGFLFLPFLLYAAVNALWMTPTPWLGKADWFLWAQMFAVFWLTLNAWPSGAPRLFLLCGAATLGLVGSALAVWQRFFEPSWLMLGREQTRYLIGRASGSFGIPNSFAAELILLLPPVIGLALQKNAPRSRLILATLLAAIYWGVLLLTLSRGAWLSLGCALAIWPLLVPTQSWRRRLTLAGLIICAGGMTTATLYMASPDARVRLDKLVTDSGESTRPIMWRASGQLLRDSPVLGAGAGSYPVLLEKYRPANFQDQPRWPHNEWLGLLSDYGMVGFSLFSGAIVVTLICARRSKRDRPAASSDPVDVWDSEGITRAIGVGLLAFALSDVVDFHLKIPALAMLAALATGEFVRRTWPPPDQPIKPTNGRRWLVGFAGLGVIIMTYTVVWPCYRAEALRYNVRHEIDWLSAEPSSAESILIRVLREAPTALEKSTAIDPENAQTWADLAYVHALRVHYKLEPNAAAAGRMAETAARRALAIGEIVPEFWVRLGVALDLQGRWGEAGPCFARAVSLAPNNGLMWYYHAYHLARRPAGLFLARSAVETSLRLDPGNLSAQSLRQELASRP